MHDDWVVGYCDEVWWSRFAQPQMHAWGTEALRLVERQKDRSDPEAAALACYGLLVESTAEARQMLLRFVCGRPVSTVSCEFLAWSCQQLAEQGKRVCVLIWDNASWHTSEHVQQWIIQHNRHVKLDGGVRLIVCLLPTKSPWLNPIEPTWLHGKRAIAEADATPTIAIVIERVCAHYGCELLPLIQQNTA